ncbi:hypothetical protein LOAG_06384 [Loa loa]|uniref:Uncharacterized protein n=2 Tax=Loa loa TaxID=7209 RepID=A0A1S0TYT9_LOALO|nr:hypothetical protein LOAG_06384 [Loa loa]EFO22099.1 hypothetical protein LOAG_06384 [Loa loa]
MFAYTLSSILLMFTIFKLSTTQFIPPYGTFGAFPTPGLLNPYLGPVGGFGMPIGYDPMLMPNMGMNLFGNSYLMNPYASFPFTNNGNSFAGYGIPKYRSSMYSRKRFIPGFGCLNRSGCGFGFQKKE